MTSAMALLRLIEESTAETQKNQKETNSEIIANQLREMSKLTKNPVLAKKIRDLADQALKL